MSAALETIDLSKCFGSLRAVNELSLTVRTGARHAVIGPNGAGKSTLFALLAGALRPTSGTVVFEGRAVTRSSEPRRAALGLVRTMQHSSLFMAETVLENVLLAVQRDSGAGFLPFLRPSRRRALVDSAMTGLEQVGLTARAGTTAGSLSHGERRQLEIAIALAAQPTMLLLDEPAAGMSPAETEHLTTLIRELPPAVTVLLVEHDLEMVFDLATEISVIHLGRHLMTGTPEVVRSSPIAQEAYLGAASADGSDPETTPTTFGALSVGEAS